MLAINEMTADAMLGTPDSDLWHNVDDLLHNVNDLMSRLDQRQGEGEGGGGGSQGAEEDEQDGIFFTRDAGNTEPAQEAAAPSALAAAGASPHTQVQVACSVLSAECSLQTQRLQVHEESYVAEHVHDAMVRA